VYGRLPQRAGERFEPASGWAIDAGYAYLWVKNGTSELATAGPPFPDSLMGTYRANVSVPAVQASCHL